MQTIDYAQKRQPVEKLHINDSWLKCSHQELKTWAKDTVRNKQRTTCGEARLASSEIIRLAKQMNLFSLLMSDELERPEEGQQYPI